MAAVTGYTQDELDARVLHVHAFGAKGDGVELVDVTTTAGSAVITSAAASFTSGDIGKTIWILTPTFQSATIASVQSATSLTMSSAASASGTNRTVNYGTDNTTALTAAVNAAKAAGSGGVRFGAGLYLASSQLPALLHQRDFGFYGEGGQGMSYGTYGTSMVARTELRYMGAQSWFISGYLTKGTRISGMAIRYANPAFTGSLINLSTTWGTYLDNFLLGGVWGGKNATLIDGKNTVECYLTSGLLERSAVGFQGGGGTYSNANVFTRVVFLGLDIAAADLKYGNTFVSSIFEPRGGSMSSDPLGAPSPVVGECHGLTFTACQWWDAIGGGGPWIDISGSGLSIHGGFWEPRGSDDLIRLNGAFDGVSINGLHGHGVGGGKLLTLAAGATASGLDVTSVSLDGSVGLVTGLNDIPLTASIGFSPSRGHLALRARGDSGAAITLSRDAVQTVTLTAGCTLSFPAVPSTVAAEMTVYLTQDATGGWDVIWPASTRWKGGSTPTFVTTPASTSEVRLVTVNGGTTWNAELVGDYAT